MGATGALLLVVLVGTAAGFNVDTSYPLVSEGDQRGSYYGFTVALRDLGRRGHRLVVGAPKANTTFNILAKPTEPGAVYQCDVQDLRCDQFAIELSGNVNCKVESRYKCKNHKDYGWLGGAISVQQTPQSPMVVCAPGWKNGAFNDYYLMNGMCYRVDASAMPASNAAILYPLSDGQHQGFILPPEPGKNKTEVYFYAYGEAGFSTHFTENGTDLLLGAPGMFDWAGSIVVYRNVMKTLKSLRIPNPIHTPKQQQYEYFGYAVSSGTFFTTPKVASGTLYVSGAPRAGDLRGKVFVFGLPTLEKHSLVVHVERVGDQLGEYFGSSLCVADLNKDGLDDLLVGAPRHSVKGPGRAASDEGRVYVFLSQDQLRLEEVTGENKIMGDGVHRANFGTSIISIGDINADGYPDIAIGAPYGGGDGRGAVYIYRGYRGGIISKYTQRILGSDISSSIRGFGISISNGIDIDDNGYNDMAVGAYISGHAVVLRTRPVVALRAELTADVNRISINATGFRVAYCISYAGENVPPALEVECALLVDADLSMAYFSMDPDEKSSNYSEIITVFNGVPECKNFTINLKSGKKDFSKGIDIRLDYSLSSERVLLKRRKRSAWEDFCKDCPVLDPSQPTSATLHVPFATGCGEEDICRTDLRVRAELVAASVPLVLGTQRSVSVDTTVENQLDPAFLARLIIEAPWFLALIRMPSSCREDSTPSLLRLDCDVGNPLTSTSGPRNITVELDVTDIRGNTTELVFNVTATSTGQEQLPGDNRRILSLKVHTVSDIRMIGASNQDTLYFSEADDSYDKEVTVKHSYEVRNYGPSKVDSVLLTFKVPVAASVDGEIITFSKLYYPKASLGGQPFSCSDSDYEFSADNSAWSKAASAGGEVDSNLPTSRRQRRSADDAGDSGAVAANETLLLDCNQHNVVCATVTCGNVGPFRSVQTGAVVELQMNVQMRDLVSILGKRTVAMMSTSGSVAFQNPPTSLQPSKESSMKKTAVTVFRAKTVTAGLELWILVLAIVAGLLLLLLLVLACVKLGFFRRSKKEELDQLKNKMEIENDDDDGDDAPVADQEV